MVKPWTRATLLKEGGLRKLFNTWRAAHEGIRVGLITNSHPDSGADGAARLFEAVEEGFEHRVEVLQKLAHGLDCEPDEAGAFLSCVDKPMVVPSRSHIGSDQREKLLKPVLQRLDLPTDNLGAVYDAALGLVADRSTDHDPLEEDVRLALLLPSAEQQQRVREARVQARTITTQEILECLHSTARPTAAHLRSAPSPPAGGKVDSSDRTVHTLPLAFRLGLPTPHARAYDPPSPVQDYVERLEWLERVDSFLEQTGGYLVVEGPAGVGKTTFLAHLAVSRGYPSVFIGSELDDPRMAIIDLGRSGNRPQVMGRQPAHLRRSYRQGRFVRQP